MKYRLKGLRYRLAFRGAVRTAHGVWAEREGLLLRLEEEGGGVGFGEVAPVPGFGTETVDGAQAVVAGLGEYVEEEKFADVPKEFGSLRGALAIAAGRGFGTAEASRKPELGGGDPGVCETDVPRSNRTLGVAALLPAGPAALQEIGPKAEIGFRIFKWKVGVGDIAEELPLLDDVCAALPGGAKLRLDANGAWDRRQAERWLERCAERPVEFVEQPSFAEASEGAARLRGVEDLLWGLAEDFPTPIGLDESLVGDGDVQRWLEAGWKGVFVLKPSLIGDLAGALARLRSAKADVVFSSALETAVGAKAGLRAAFQWNSSNGGESPESGNQNGKATAPAAIARALGFGVWPLFTDARFNGPSSAPFIRESDVDRIDPEKLWNALS